MADTKQELTEQSLTTADGTLIGWYTTGAGPSLVIIHGAVSSALTQLELAQALSTKFTVHIYSRASRGLSGPYSEPIAHSNPLDIATNDAEQTTNPSLQRPIYSPVFSAAVLQADLSHLAALVHSTSTKYLLGVSGGGVLALEALLPASIASFPPLKSIQKAIIFDPPLSFSPSASPPASVPDKNTLDFALLQRFEAELSGLPDSNGTKPDLDAALVTAMLVAQLGPPILASFPRFFLRWMTRQMCNGEEGAERKRREAGGKDRGLVTMRQLCPSLRYEFALVEGTSRGGVERIKAADRRKILLLGGSESPAYLREALGALEAAFAGHGDGGIAEGVRRVEIKGVGHGVLGNKDRRGDVSKAVPIIEDFFI